MMKRIVCLLVVFCLSLCGAAAEGQPAQAKRLRLSQTEAKVLREQTLQLTAAVEPANAAEPPLRWSSSDEAVATVSPEGIVTPTGCGECTILCETTDGRLSASCSLFVPTISLANTEFTLTDPEGLKIPITFYGRDLRAENQSARFHMDASIKRLLVWPDKAGTGKIVLRDTRDSRNSVALTITVAPEALFDGADYPERDFSTMRRYAADYVGQKLKVVGWVSGVEEGWTEKSDDDPDDSYVTLWVATNYRYDHGSYCNLTYTVRVPKTETTPQFLNGNDVIVYGTLRGGEPYTVTSYNVYSVVQEGEFNELKAQGYLAEDAVYPDYDYVTTEQKTTELYIDAAHVQLTDGK